jgi:hypothetical protein
LRVGSDRILYLSRVLARKLKDNLNLRQKADDETVRRAVMRELTESYEALAAIEEKVRAALSKRKTASPRDQEFLFNRMLEDELRRHGV